MRKYGKYEKRPEEVPGKQPKVKSALLQTYFASLLCIVLCVTMFFGTTFAWFTSEVTNTGNEIYIGALDVGLFAGEKDLSEAGNKLFDSSILWEPGYTALKTVTVKNEGNLAFHYSLTFTDGKVNGTADEQLQAAAKWFDVWVYHDAAGSAPAAGSYAQITAANSGWTRVGTLAEVLDGRPVLEGCMDQEDAAVKGTAHTYTIALHMGGEQAEPQEKDALNALMGKKLELSVKLVASQRSAEP